MSSYKKWIEAGRPDSFPGKAQIVVDWWKTDPTKEQMEIVHRWLQFFLIVGIITGLVVFFAIMNLVALIW